MNASKNKCEVEGCTAARSSGTLCSKHFVALHPEESQCKFSGCKKIKRARGLCTQHYNALYPSLTRCKCPGCHVLKRRGGFCVHHLHDMDLNDTICKIANCNRESVERGICKLHLLDFRHQRIRTPNGYGKPCAYNGCKKFAHVNELCIQHIKEIHAEVIPEDACSNPDCLNTQSKYGLCEDHVESANVENIASLAGLE